MLIAIFLKRVTLFLLKQWLASLCFVDLLLFATLVSGVGCCHLLMGYFFPQVIPPEWIEIPQASPSLLLALKVAVLPEDFGAIRLNISWAINIDRRGSLIRINCMLIEIDLEK